MAVPSLVVTSTGISGPDYPTVLAALQADFQSIYGSDIDISPDTQDGQLIGIFALAIFNAQQSCIAAYNSFSPATAQGVGLSSVVKINGLSRQVATNSQAIVTVVGVAGTTITNGIVGDNLGLNTQWALPATVLIPLSGTIDVTATCTAEGSTTAALNTLTQILTPTYGWQSVTNAAASTTGNPIESDALLRQRQSSSTSLAALANLGAIYAAIANVSGVTRLQVYNNDTDLTDVNGIPPHSISAVVQGGDTIEIATAIANKKAPGTGTYGDITETIIDPHGIAAVIDFYALAIAELDVVINIVALNGFATTTELLIQQAVQAYVQSLAIGEDSYLLRLVAPANLEGDRAVAGTGMSQFDLDVLGETFTVLSVAQCAHGGSPVALNLAIAFNAAADLLLANITVNVVTFMRMVSTPSAVLTFGQVYSQTNVGAAGTSPYSYFLASGTLPTGTTLNTSTGTVSGTLSAHGTFTYTITGRDSGVPPQYVSNTITAVIP